jgi:Zn-dependent protease
MAPPTTTTTTTYTQPQYNYGQTTPQRTGRVFSRIEVRDILIAWLGLGLAFFMADASDFGLPFPGVGALLSGSFKAMELFAITLTTLGFGFVFHELMHKFTAERYGYWAEFRMWPFGLVLALITSFLGIIFAAPGATYIAGTNISESENGKISVAGPLTNVFVAGIFLPILLYGLSIVPPSPAPGYVPFWAYLGLYGVGINIFLALFNMLPFMPLDGAKVFKWSKPRWAALFIPLVIAFIVFFIETGFF